ncbi:MAG: N-acetyltransferase [Cyanobacteria bacterium P01_F01_bin.150]
MDVEIRQASDAEQQAIFTVATEAFVPEASNEIVGLIADLLGDRTAQPLLSLVATVQDQVVGHILFTHARIKDTQREVSASILAPLAVLPVYQNQGVGGRLINAGLKQLKAAGTELVFVLGYPAYYSRHGFVPAEVRGFEPTYAIPPEQADAWMVQELQPDILGKVQGTVQCADALDNPKYWRE